MKYHIIKPAAELAEIVRYFWVFEGEPSASEPYVLRTLASGCPEFIFHYKGKFSELKDGHCDASFLAGVHGQTNLFRRFATKETFGIFGVYLYPYALKLIFGIPALEFTNQLPDIRSLLGKTECSIKERMFHAKDNRERQQIMTSFLIGQKNSRCRKEIAFAVRQVIDRKGNVDISELSSQCFVSHRQFERNFKEHTGFSAKSFARIIRFNSLFGDYKTGDKSLTQIALDFGYYDQSHFIHDFRLFSGYNPRTYFSGKATELI